MTPPINRVFVAFCVEASWVPQLAQAERNLSHFGVPFADTERMYSLPQFFRNSSDIPTYIPHVNSEKCLIFCITLLRFKLRSMGVFVEADIMNRYAFAFSLNLRFIVNVNNVLKYLKNVMMLLFTE